MLGGRPPRMILEAIFAREHYVALARMVRLYPEPGRIARRYFFGGGDYPYPARVRTPVGEVKVTTYSHHDIFTVHEIFGREDYRAGDDLGVVVDIGSNIGVSGLYALTRNDVSRCYLYEPVPRNLERLRRNLAGYESRYTVQEVAVATDDQVVSFTVEPTGRYGGIAADTGTERIEVSCRSIVNVLAEVLERETEVSMLKIDSEGSELATVAAIPAEQLARIRTICFETREPFNPAPELFTMSFATETCRLDRR